MEETEGRIDLLLRCPQCNEDVRPDITPSNNGTTTTYKATCPLCGTYIKWLSKSIFEGVKKQNGRRRKPAWSASTVGIEYCELCGRTRECLGINEKLECHHKVPIEHGGTDTRDNILILCSPCHRMAHFLRTYLNEHLLYLFESGVSDVRKQG
jgi:5-methylcytosine-specific restriction endonuclease McrA